MALPEKNFEITEGVFCTVSEFRGKMRVDIRKWYQNKDGEWKGTPKGINLTLEQWDDFVASFEDIQNFVKESK